MQFQPQTSPWAPWLAWILGNTAGAAIGVAVATTVILLIGADEHGIASFVLAPAIAACMVMAQWLVIRQYLPRAIWWILASVVGVFLGAAVIGVVAWIAEATLGGDLVGTTMRGAEALVVPCSLYGASIGFAAVVVPSSTHLACRMVDPGECFGRGSAGSSHGRLDREYCRPGLDWRCSRSHHGHCVGSADTAAYRSQLQHGLRGRCPTRRLPPWAAAPGRSCTARRSAREPHWTAWRFLAGCSATASAGGRIHCGSGRARMRENGGRARAAPSLLAAVGRASLEHAPNSLIGGRYRVIHRIGSGGMAHVYQALDLNLQRQVAIKVLREDLIADPAFERAILAGSTGGGQSRPSQYRHGLRFWPRRRALLPGHGIRRRHGAQDAPATPRPSAGRAGRRPDDPDLRRCWLCAPGRTGALRPQTTEHPRLGRPARQDHRLRDRPRPGDHPARRDQRGRVGQPTILRPRAGGRRAALPSQRRVRPGSHPVRDAHRPTTFPGRRLRRAGRAPPPRRASLPQASGSLHPTQPRADHPQGALQGALGPLPDRRSTRPRSDQLCPAWRRRHPGRRALAHPGRARSRGTHPAHGPGRRFGRLAGGRPRLVGRPGCRGIAASLALGMPALPQLPLNLP